LQEALAAKAEQPDALPIQGGTDVMVALNFDRARPGALLNLNEVPELRGWSRADGELRLGAGLTYTEAMSGRLAEALPALAEARDPAVGDRDVDVQPLACEDRQHTPAADHDIGRLVAARNRETARKR